MALRIDDQRRGDPEEQVVLGLVLGEKWAGRVEEGLGIGEPHDLDGRLGHPASLRGNAAASGSIDESAASGAAQAQGVLAMPLGCIFRSGGDRVGP